MGRFAPAPRVRPLGGGLLMVDGVRREWSEVADGVAAFTQLPGTWGWSNSGLVSGDGASLLVDTLFDTTLTVSMLEEAAGLVGRSGPW